MGRRRIPKVGELLEFTEHIKEGSNWEIGQKVRVTEIFPKRHCGASCDHCYANGRLIYVEKLKFKPDEMYMTYPICKMKWKIVEEEDSE